MYLRRVHWHPRISTLSYRASCQNSLFRKMSLCSNFFLRLFPCISSKALGIFTPFPTLPPREVTDSIEALADLLQVLYSIFRLLSDTTTLQRLLTTLYDSSYDLITTASRLLRPSHDSLQPLHLNSLSALVLLNVPLSFHSSSYD